MTETAMRRVLENLLRQYLEDVRELQRAYNQLADETKQRENKRFTFDPTSVTAVRNARIALGQE